ncbi:hypothetical protein D3C78_1924900 [compost metagenome]
MALRRQVDDLATQRSGLEQRNQALQSEAVASAARLAEMAERVATLQLAAEQLTQIKPSTEA